MPPKILLAENDASVRDTLGRVLESEHYIVTFAATGRDAAEEFFADIPDLVLLDLDMLNQGDWDVFGVMRQMHPLIPVVVITAKSQPLKRASDFGIDALMEKPLHLPLLLATIADLMAEPGTERLSQKKDPGFKTLYLENRP
jgi:CheY-like chemotaxis protein